MKTLKRSKSDIHKFGTVMRPNPKYENEYRPKKEYKKKKVPKHAYDKYFRDPKIHTEYDRPYFSGQSTP
jgi:hypothetical protein